MNRITDGLNEALATASAIAALKLKGARLVGTSGGVEINQPGKPILLLTPWAVRRFAQERAEAEAQ